MDIENGIEKKEYSTSDLLRVCRFYSTFNCQLVVLINWKNRDYCQWKRKSRKI